MTTLIDHLDPALLTGEPFAGIADLARAIRAEGIARDARRLDERTRASAGREHVRARIFEQLCVRLHQHVETMWQALAWTDAEENTRVHSLTVCRLLCESALERCIDSSAAARVQLARDLELERTKFVMGTTVDALVELRQQTTGQSRREGVVAADALGRASVARFRARIRPAMTATIAQCAHATLRDLYAAFGDLARSAPELVFTLIDLETMQLHDRPLHVRKLRDPAQVLLALLEDGSRGAVEDALDRFDLARSELEHRTCELLDDAIVATRACGAFARTAHRAGPARLADTREQLRSWATRLDRLTGRSR